MSSKEKLLEDFARFEAPLLVRAEAEGRRRSLYDDARVFLAYKEAEGLDVSPKDSAFISRLVRNFEDALRYALED